MIEAAQLRSWWAHKQGLDGSFDNAPPATILVKSGWARSVGGANPYLTLFARSEFSREAIDLAAKKLEIYELPAARGCTYVVPASHFALALKVGQGFGDDSSVQTAVKFLGVTEKEIDHLSERILQALQSGPQDPRALKQSVGAAVRNLGDAGKKRGITTTLPLALGRLQSSGQIRRLPVNGRLDQQRYSYELWNPSPLVKFKLTIDQTYEELARLFFRWIGPAMLKEFQWFSGLGVKTSKSAVEPLGLVPVEEESELLILPDELDAFHAFKISKKPQYSLVSCLDGIFLLRRDVANFLEKSDFQRTFLKKPLGQTQDLEANAILDRGRLIGLWEFDPSSGSIAASLFVQAGPELNSAIKRTEKFIRDQLGDARSFSLDSPESRTPRIAELKAQAGR